jgi:hypothetical protein
MVEGVIGQSASHPRRAAIGILVAIQLDYVLDGNIDLFGERFKGNNGLIALEAQEVLSDQPLHSPQGV